MSSACSAICGGGWYRALAPTHLSRAHGLTADEDRELVGLLPRHALWAPELIEAHSARLRARVVVEPGAMAKGRVLAQRGVLQSQARSRLAERPVSLERERQPVETGARLGNGRAAAYRHRRSRRAVELGFSDLIAYYERRYRDERRRLDEIAAELGSAESAVRGDLQRLGLGPDRTRSHRALASGALTFPDTRPQPTDQTPGCSVSLLLSGEGSRRYVPPKAPERLAFARGAWLVWRGADPRRMRIDPDGARARWLRRRRRRQRRSRARADGYHAA